MRKLNMEPHNSFLKSKQYDNNAVMINIEVFQF